MKKFILLIALSFCFFTIIYAQPGELDTSFSGDGITDFRYGIQEYKAFAIQSDGKIVVAGLGNSIIRYNSNGTLDLNFGENGLATLGFSTEINSAAIQSDGKIVVAGTKDQYPDSSMLARFNTDGSPDNSFSDDGTLIFNFDGNQSSIKSASIQSDGKIVVFCVSTGFDARYTIARFYSDGSLDTGFSGDGKLISQFNEVSTGKVVIQTDGKIIVIAENKSPLRLNNDGSEDRNYDDTQGLFFGAAAVLQSDGKLVVAGRYFRCDLTGSDPGSCPTTFGLVRYNTDGRLDKTFGNNGEQSTDIKGILVDDGAFSVVIQDDGKIIAGGFIDDAGGSGTSPQRPAFVRYNTNGGLDSSFSNSGIEITRTLHSGVAGMAIFKDKLYAITRDNIARYLLTENKVTTVSITSPNNDNYRFREPATINITAKATNSNGTITKVEFYNGSDLLSADYSSPYSYKWENVPVGNYALTAKAADNSGIVTTSAIVYTTVVPNDPPVVTMTNPLDGSIYKKGDNIQLQMRAENHYLTLKYLQFYDEVPLAADGPTLLQTYDVEQGDHSDYSFSYNTHLSAGPHKLIAKATDVFGVTASDTVDITVILNPADVRIASPFNNDTFGAPATIVISAVATDSLYKGNTISKMEFYNDTTLLYADSAAPFTYIWKNVPAGNFLLTAKAIYSSGITFTSPIVHISVVPSKTTLSLTIPGNILKYTGPARIKLNAAVTNVSGTIKKVQFYNGTNLLHTETLFPYGFLWIDVPIGSYTLTAKAYDNQDQIITSNAIDVAVVEENVPPVVSIVSPVNDTTYTGPATIHLIAKAKDPNDKISKVEFYSGSTLLRTEHYYPYTYWWTNVQPGTYTITAVAYDDKGLSTTSAAITVTVTNASIVSRPSSVTNKTDINGALSVKLSPNPARSTLQIFTKGLQLNKPSTISVISASGVVMKTIQSGNLNKVVPLDVSSLQSGVYTIKVVNGDKVMFKQFVKM